MNAAQHETGEVVNYLLKAVWVQLGLVYYLYCHLWREEKTRLKLKPQQRERGCRLWGKVRVIT